MKKTFFVCVSFFITALLLLNTTRAMGQKKPVSVFITAGQSNAEGRAPANTRPDYLNEEGAYAHLHYAFVRTEQTGQFSKFEFGKTFAFCDVTNYLINKRLNTDFYAVKCTFGGTSITPGQYSEKEKLKPMWYADKKWLKRNKAHSSAGGGLSLTLSLTEGFKKCVDSCLSKLPEGYDVKAIMWHQGEGDRLKPESYYENFKTMIVSMRKQIAEVTGKKKDRKLPFILGTVPRNSRQYNAKVEEAQMRVARELPNVYIIPLHKMPLLRDGLHFDAEGTEQVGRLMFDKLVELGLVSE